jgi:hypothetical protein
MSSPDSITIPVETELERIMGLLQILKSLEYWNGISECECSSTLPSGGCLSCDTDCMIEQVKTLLKN